METYLQYAIEQARIGVGEGGMPFGACLVVDGVLVSAARNRQIQSGDYFAHAETECLRHFVRQPLHGREAVLYATEAPCPMCAGAALIAGVKKLVVGEAVHYQGALDWLSSQPMEVVLLNDPECLALVEDFKSGRPELWHRFSAG